MTVPETVVRAPRPLKPVPADLAACQAYCRELIREIERLDRRWAQLKADAFDLDRQGYQMDVCGFMRGLESRL